VAANIPDARSRSRALSALAQTLITAEEYTQAREVAAAIPDAHEQAHALTVLSTALTTANDLAQAQTVAESIADVGGRAAAFQKIHHALLATQNTPTVVSNIGRIWRGVMTRTELLSMLPVIFPLLAYEPQHVSGICGAFGWVDDQLRDGGNPQAVPAITQA
jgi:hypothetical protein